MNAVIDKFSMIGARAQLTELAIVRPAVQARANLFQVDVRQDRRGAYFNLAAAPRVEFSVIDVEADSRHLLLLARHELGKDKFLCGHDERDWFTAAVPEIGGVRDVATAKEALKPALVRWMQLRAGLDAQERERRRTRIYIRQGEWFFVPDRKFCPPDGLVLRNEPIRRGAGKPHWCEWMYRTRGTKVYVSDKYPRGVTEGVYQKLVARGVRQSWRVMMRDARVYVRGRISHPDHKSLSLPFWHQVLMNTEGQAPAAVNVVFLD